MSLVSLLKQQQEEVGLVKSWVSRNRPCLTLADICHVPSAKKDALSLLMPFKTDIEQNASSTEGHTSGAKILLEAICDNK